MRALDEGVGEWHHLEVHRNPNPYPNPVLGPAPGSVLGSAPGPRRRPLTQLLRVRLESAFLGFFPRGLLDSEEGPRRVHPLRPRPHLLPQA